MILVVDDYQDSAEALCWVLDSRGFDSRWSTSGPDALAIIRSHPPEQPLLVVLDALMPEMSGIEVLQNVRADPQIRGTTIMMYSAGVKTADRAQAMSLGAVAWLQKGGGRESDVDAVIGFIIQWYQNIGGVPVHSEK